MIVCWEYGIIKYLGDLYFVENNICYPMNEFPEKKNPTSIAEMIENVKESEDLIKKHKMEFESLSIKKKKFEEKQNKCRHLYYFELEGTWYNFTCIKCEYTYHSRESSVFLILKDRGYVEVDKNYWEKRN